MDMTEIQEHQSILAGTATKEQLKASFDRLNKFEPKTCSILADIAFCCEFGIGCVKDEEKAFQNYFRGSLTDENERSKATCLNNLGTMYLQGKACIRDNKLAFEYYQKASNLQNLPVASLNVAICFSNGWGVEKDDSKAFVWFQKATLAGASGASRRLADCYYNGTGTKKNTWKAMNLYQKLDPDFSLSRYFQSHWESLREHILDLETEKRKYRQFVIMKELEPYLLKDICLIVALY
jgi:TPR repeat protein